MEPRLNPPLDGLNEPQREAVLHVDGPLLVLAGAGSGKTRVITHRIANLIACGVAPWQILGITFTNKAAGEMRERVEAMGTPRGTTVCTFHALCVRLLREFAEDARLGGNFSIYDRDDQLKVIKQAMKNADVPTDRLPAFRVHAAISRAKNDLTTAEDFAAAADGFAQRQMAKVFTEYQRLLAANNALDFDDLLLRVAFLLRDRPDIREGLAQRYRYLLIDEYQDTNRAQYLIAHGIAMHHGNICATGDPDQSIYAWRGADIRNILEFESNYPDAKVVRLEENYRSTNAILASATRLIANNLDRPEKALWTRREGGADVKIVECDDGQAEAQEVSRRLADAAARGYRYDQMAVFYRMNSLSRTLERALVQARIPYRIARGVEFYNRKEIKDVLAYLRTIANPRDDVSCARIINTPARGIGAKTVERLSQHAARRGVGLLEACGDAASAGLSAAAAKKARAFADMVAAWAAGPHTSVRELIERVLENSGLIGSLKTAAEKDDERPLENVEELLSEAAEFDEDHPEATLADYLFQVSLVADVDHFRGGEGAVSLMTLHAAKGLEFPVVCMVACEQGLLPMERRDGSDDPRSEGQHLAEERRLAFVGITRAQDELTLLHSRMRRIRGRMESQAASPFLFEIAGDGVVTEDRTTGPARRIAGPSYSGGGFYDEAGQRSRIEAGYASGAFKMPPSDGIDYEDYAQLPPELEHLAEGVKVFHSKFGTGTVLKLKHPYPETRAEILFDQVGKKTIVIAFTDLQIQGS
mgnify:CR=1 FL=1